MEKIIGAGNRLLEINLTDQRVEELFISSEDRWAYLGGKGLGVKLLAERLEPGIDPLGEKNWLAFIPGVLLGTGAPCSGRFSGLTKSPLTGILIHVSCGGPFGMAFKTAGYDGLLITGKAASPTLLEIDAKGVRFEDATHLWGLNTRRSQDALIKDDHSGALVIGPAGEQTVRYANIASGHRFLNRGGMGAVMGAKNLKAIVAHGGAFQVVPKDVELFNDAMQTASAYIDLNPTTGKVYPRYGTASHVSWCNKNHILPIKNFSAAHHPNAANISGEAISFAFKTSHQTCLSCRIRCGHATFTEEGRALAVPDYDALAMLGPNLGIFDARHIIIFNDLCGLWGLDPVSTGAVLAWSMEAGEKGVIQSPLTFGTPQGIAQAIEDIVYGRELGEALARGTRYLSETYGGGEYAMHVKGLEIGAYDPRGAWGQGLGYAVANAGGCHRSSALFALEAGLGVLSPCATQGKAHWVAFFENLYAATESLHMCQLTAFAFLMEGSGIKKVPQVLLKPVMAYLPFLAIMLIDVDIYAQFFSAVTGDDYSQKDFLKAGERIHVLERLLNTKEGIRRKDDTLPQRLLTEWRKNDPDKYTVPLDVMLPEYYALRGYDDEGVPTKKKLESLDILEFSNQAAIEEITSLTLPSTANSAKNEDFEENIKKDSPDRENSNHDNPEIITLNKESPGEGVEEKKYEIATLETEETPTELFVRSADDEFPETPCCLITPDHTSLQRYFAITGLWVLGRVISAAYFVDQEIRQEFEALPDDFIFALSIAATGPQAIIAKSAKGRPRFLGTQPQQIDIDLLIQLKGLKIISDLSSVISFKKKAALFFPKHRVIVKGDLATACRVARILEVVTIYLLPARLARRMVRVYPSWSYQRKYWGRLRISVRALIGI